MRQEFSPKTMLAAWDRCEGICECGCEHPIKPERPEYHHRVEAKLGGTNDISNCMVIRKSCHRRITSEHSIPMLAKVERIRRKNVGAVRKPRSSLSSSKWKKKISGEVVAR